MSQSTKRPYLRRDERKDSLLDIAERIVDRDGWTALTMISLAAEAKVSRQLIYQHFSSIEDLCSHVIDRMFGDYHERLAETWKQLADTPMTAVAQAMDILHSVGDGRRNALWAIVATPGNLNTATSVAAKKLRRQTARLPLPGVPEAVAAEAQMTIDQYIRLMEWALWGTQMMISDGVMNAEEAKHAMQWLVQKSTTPAS